MSGKKSNPKTETEPASRKSTGNIRFWIHRGESWQMILHKFLDGKGKMWYSQNKRRDIL
jgi:hypothetical protein